MSNDAFRPSVNGLRGIAVLMVILFHWSHVRGGFTGVDVFFVISGYLISGHIARDLQQGRFSFASFYAKRTRRIVPSLVLVLLFAVGLGWFRSFDDQFRLLGSHIQSGALFLSNFRLYGESNYFDAAVETKPLLHLWSLGIEEQFYLVWPVLLWAAFRIFGSIQGTVIVATVLSFAANVYLSTHHAAMAFYLLPARLWELAFGALILPTRSRLRPFYDSPIVQLGGLLLILFGCGIRPDSFPGVKALIPVVGAGLLLGASENGWINRTLLSSRFLGFFGAISYTLYLWHWPLFSFMKSLMLNDAMLALSLIALLLSYATHRFVEKPWMSFPITPGNRIRVVSMGVATLLVIAAVGTFIGNGTLHGRMITSSLPAAADHRTGVPCGVNGDLPFNPEPLKACDRLSFPKAPVILLIGDSHAVCLNDGMDAFAKENHLNLVTHVAVYCTPLSLHDHRAGCQAFNQYLQEWISKRKPDLVVLAAHHLHWPGDSAYGESVPYPEFIASRLREIQSITGKQVLLVGQNPTWNVSLPRVLNIAFLGKGLAVPERTLLGLDEESIRWDQVVKDQASKQGIPYFSMKDELCTAEGCRVRVGDRLESDLVDFDYGHLSHQGALHVVRNGLGAKIKSLLKSGS